MPVGPVSFAAADPRAHFASDLLQQDAIWQPWICRGFPWRTSRIGL